MDSTGLSALVSGLMRTGEGGGGMAVVCTRPQILRLLALTGLDQVLKVHSTRRGGCGLNSTPRRSSADFDDCAGSPARVRQS